MAVSTANTGLLNFSQIRYKSLDCAQNQTPNFATPLRSPDYTHVLNREPLVVGKIDVFPLTNSGAKISFASISPRKKILTMKIRTSVCHQWPSLNWIRDWLALDNAHCTRLQKIHVKIFCSWILQLPCVHGFESARPHRRHGVFGRAFPYLAAGETAVVGS